MAAKGADETDRLSTRCQQDAHLPRKGGALVGSRGCLSRCQSGCLSPGGAVAGQRHQHWLCSGCSLDERYELVALVAVPAGELAEFFDLRDEGTLVWCSADCDRASSPHLEQAFVAQHA